MKIFLNRKPVAGPYGGGNRTLLAVYNEIIKRGHQVVFSPSRDVDIIFCMDPRQNPEGIRYEHLYQMKTRFGCPILQRVGDIGTHNKPELTELVKKTVEMSDVVIFPSLWAKLQINPKKEAAVIPNKPLVDFYEFREAAGNPSSLFTHHWSDNPKKGFDFYSTIEQKKTENKCDFTFMGRRPNNFFIENYKEAGTVSEIKNEMKKHGIYITASKEEAGANHVLEALASGLPVIYHKQGGSIVDYCHPYGVGFETEEEFWTAVQHVRTNYDHFRNKVKHFLGTTDDVAKEYVDLMEQL